MRIKNWKNKKAGVIEMIENEVKDMSLFKLGWPVFVQSLLSLCLGYVDTLMISRYSICLEIILML